MRPATATAAAVTALIGAAATLAAGRHASDAALKVEPGKPLPTDPALTVHATASHQVALTRSLASQRPGVFGLTGHACHAVVGPVVEHAPHTADTVVRRLDRVTHGTLDVGTKVWLTPQVHLGNPRTALGLDHADVDIPGELGGLPAWFVPADRDTWVITVHGLGATREHPMVVMEFLHGMRIPVLDIAYRGDLGAPRSPDGLAHLGETEWRDLDAALRYAVRYGARNIVVHGWSTGATMALHALTHSALRDRISGLILDSPVLDWEGTVRALAAGRTPAPLLPLAVRAAQGRTGLSGDRTAGVAASAAVDIPVLVFHGPDDTIAPWAATREFAARRPDLITLHSVPGATHGAMWNADPRGYEETMRRFLTPLL
ncbi:prolyl oligopeptidase family serine peptidase [Streptomyces sp. TRM66268-LWL]|uniref:Prolyl oligopeptidase family serine peptidase n=1 Tax=Streptomyces polyasparticus TaxID=2767826 RepID=A0ABR7SB61_9ACTN|nr:prolyl oligopeptidase family serine peptidase [Streptomyces polyasparticus]MBC9711852.1 prolyl oligopeptidase family serine peptidase [Streptomyces polyasparticus]